MFNPSWGKRDEQKAWASAVRRTSCSARALGFSSCIHLLMAGFFPLMCGCSAVTLPEIMRNVSAGPGFLASPTRFSLFQVIQVIVLQGGLLLLRRLLWADLCTIVRLWCT